MNCLWEDTDDKDARGWRRVRCRRYGCGIVSGVTPHPHDKIHSHCRGVPLPRELGYWVGMLLATAGITKARWSWLGRKLGWLVKDECCQCADREKWLNKFGERVAGWLG